MPEPNSPHVNSTPAQSYQPYDAAHDNMTNLPPWGRGQMQAGKCDINSGACQGEDSWDSTPPWDQT
jgi:hypothetical protein